MDIKNKLFKFKRAVHRNRAIISRVFSITLTVALLAFVAWGAYKIYQSDLKVKAEEGITNDDPNKIVAKDPIPEVVDQFELVAENEKLKLFANLTNGSFYVEELATGKKWYSNPMDRQLDKDELAKGKEIYKFSSQFRVSFYNLKTRVATTDPWCNYKTSTALGGMTHTIVKDGNKNIGIRFDFAFPEANVVIPVQYTLGDGGFKAEILSSEITPSDENHYLVTSIELLPYFGAAGLGETGDLFVPDGSGALIHYNSNKKVQSYNAQVYGKNITLLQSTAENVTERISMPVFGTINKGAEGAGDDSAMLGVIISGETCSMISASPSVQTEAYNKVYPTAILHETQLIKSETNVHVGVATKVLQMSDDLMIGKDYAVLYYFLNGDDANYVGMAEKYREHLTQKQKLNNSAMNDNKYLVIDVVGAVSIEKYVFGIKKPVVTPMTTYNQVVEIAKNFKDQGVDNLVINYIGALDSGLNNKMFSSVETESVLGSKKDFQNMVAQLNEMGVKLFIETNPVDLYNNGHGYDTNADAAKTFFKKYAFQYQYTLDSQKLDNATRWHLLHPAKVPAFVQGFADSMEAWGLKNISLDRLGAVLYSDYNEEAEAHTTRGHSIDLWSEAMKYAGDKSDFLMLHGGNAYALAYADVLTDISTTSSNYDVSDVDIPFYQIAFQGNAVLTPRALNTSVDYTYEFLKALETGCSLKYNLLYADVATLVGTEYNTMVSYSYSYWKDIVVSQYLEMQKATAQFAGKQIVDHVQLADGVYLTEYENGKIIVNYNESAYVGQGEYAGTTVEPRHYVVLAGGTK